MKPTTAARFAKAIRSGGDLLPKNISDLSLLLVSFSDGCPSPLLRLQINSFAESDVSMTALSSICPSSQAGWIDRGRGRKGEGRTILGGDGFFVLMIFGTSNFKIMGMTNATLSVDIQEEGGRELLKKDFVRKASFGYLAIF